MIERERGNIKCEIVKRFGVLNTYPTGWSKEFNLVKWNDKTEKYDIRDWAPGHERMSRGVTMHEEEIVKLMELCTGLFDCQKSAADAPEQAAPPESAQNTSMMPESGEVPF